MHASEHPGWAFPPRVFAGAVLCMIGLVVAVLSPLMYMHTEWLNTLRANGVTTEAQIVGGTYHKRRSWIWYTVDVRWIDERGRAHEQNLAIDRTLNDKLALGPKLKIASIPVRFLPGDRPSARVLETLGPGEDPLWKAGLLAFGGAFLMALAYLLMASGADDAPKRGGGRDDRLSASERLRRVSAERG